MGFNTMTFTPEDVELGLHYDLLNYLLIYNAKAKNSFNDIHITSDGYCTIVEWDNVPYSKEWGGKFEYVAEDEVIAKEFMFPDNHYELIYPDDEEDILREWLKDNPEYKKDDYGRWYNENEIIKINEDLKGELDE